MKTKIDLEPFKEILENFEHYLRTVPDRNGKIRSENSIRVYLLYIRNLAEFLRVEGRKDFKDVDTEILKRFVMEYKGKKSRIAKGKKFVIVETPVQWQTRNVLINVLCVFYRWLNNDEEPNYLKPLKKLVVRPPIEERTRVKKPSDILTVEEVLKMIKACNFENSPFIAKRDKAILAVLYEGGLRVGELANAKIGDLAKTDYGFMLTVRGKTGTRTIPLIDSQVYIEEWLRIHPAPENQNSPLFVEAYKPNEPVSTHSIYHMVKGLAKRAKIPKKVFPHLLRHSRASNLLRILSEQPVKKYLGWSKSSPMLQFYSHISSKDVEDELLKAYGIKPQQEPSIALHKKCSVCGKVNSPENVVCDSCGNSLISSIKTLKVLDKVEKVDELNEKISRLEKGLEKILQTLTVFLGPGVKRLVEEQGLEEVYAKVKEKYR